MVITTGPSARTRLKRPTSAATTAPSPISAMAAWPRVSCLNISSRAPKAINVDDRRDDKPVGGRSDPGHHGTGNLDR